MLFKKYKNIVLKFISLLIIFINQIVFLPIYQVNSQISEKVKSQEEAKAENFWGKYKKHVIAGTSTAMMVGVVICLASKKAFNKSNSDDNKLTKCYILCAMGKNSVNVWEDILNNGGESDSCRLRLNGEIVRIDEDWKDKEVKLNIFNIEHLKKYEDNASGFFSNSKLHILMLDLDSDREDCINDIESWAEIIARARKKNKSVSNDLVTIAAYKNNIDNKDLVRDLEQELQLCEFSFSKDINPIGDILLINKNDGKQSITQVKEKLLSSLDLISDDRCK